MSAPRQLLADTRSEPPKEHAFFDIYFLEIMLCTIGDGLRRTAVIA